MQGLEKNGSQSSYLLLAPETAMEDTGRPRLNSKVLRKSRDIQRLVAQQEKRRYRMERLTQFDDIELLEKMLRETEITDFEERAGIRQRIIQLKKEELGQGSPIQNGMNAKKGRKSETSEVTLRQKNKFFADPRPLSTPSTPKTKNLLNQMERQGQIRKPSLRSANSIKELLLRWCQLKTKEYPNINLTNFSGCWADGMAFCALIHHFFPDSFDYSRLDPRNRRGNLDLAFSVAEQRGDIMPLLEVEDMLIMGDKPDWKCIFTYVQSIYNALKDRE